jgi:putative Holliday junction resolvase
MTNNSNNNSGNADENITQKRILAFDIGSKRIGLATWNPEARLASTLPMRVRKTLKEDIAYFKNVILEKKAEAILVGLPISLGGKKTESTENALFWVGQLKKHFDLPVRTYDESLSSVEAMRLMKLKTTKQKKLLKDSLSAALFLEEFIRAQS